MKKFVFIVFGFSVLFSCNNKFEDFTEKDEHVYMKLISFTDDELPFGKNQLVKARIELYSGNHKIFNHYPESVIYPDKNDFKFLFSHLNQGDSAVFMIESSFFKKEFLLLNLADVTSEYIEARVKIVEYSNYSNEEIDDEMTEQILLKKYLKQNDVIQHRDGIYFKQIKKGKGELVKSGKTITIHYKGSFINLLEFDNTYKTSDFTFTYGTPGQVIKGLEIALSGMKKGEKAKIIIPSQLAFGEEGSSTGIIQPFTTVIYELEIVNVN